jgi:hypothetical protein
MMRNPSFTSSGRRLPRLAAFVAWCGVVWLSVGCLGILPRQGANCQTDDECPAHSGLLCVDGTCEFLCHDNRDCPHSGGFYHQECTKTATGVKICFDGMENKSLVGSGSE